MEQLQQQQEQHVQITNLAAAVARAAAAFNAHDFNAAHNAAAAGGPVDLPREPQVITVSFVIEAPIEMPEGVLFNLPLRPTQPAANAAPGAQNNTPSAGGAPSTVPTPDALPPGFPDVARITAAREEFGRRLTQLLSLGAQRGAHAPAGGGDQQPAATLLERGDVPNTLTAPAPATAQQPSQGDSFRAVLMEMIAATAEASDRVEHLNRDVAAAAATGNVDVPEQPVPAPITPPPPRPTPMSEGPHDADGVPEAGSGPWGRRIRYDRQFHSIAEAVNYIGQMIVGGGLADVATASGFLFPMHQHQRPGAAPAGVRAVEQLREVALPRVVKGRDGKIHTDNDAYNAGVDRRMLKRKQATQAVSAKTEPLGERRVAAVAAEPPTEGAVDVGLDEDGCVIHVEEHEDGAEVMKHVEDGRMKRGKSREEVWRPYKRARISL
ncbi:hypothetical protein HK101_000558 [Irineochytrium annulatum]|nr:hypothetical protein HK101_000558 [Irineochytrium annulatum]